MGRNHRATNEFSRQQSLAKYTNWRVAFKLKWIWIPNGFQSRHPTVDEDFLFSTSSSFYCSSLVKTNRGFYERKEALRACMWNNATTFPPLISVGYKLVCVRIHDCSGLYWWKISVCDVIFSDLKIKLYPFWQRQRVAAKRNFRDEIVAVQFQKKRWIERSVNEIRRLAASKNEMYVCLVASPYVNKLQKLWFNNFNRGKNVVDNKTRKSLCEIQINWF